MQMMLQMIRLWTFYAQFLCDASIDIFAADDIDSVDNVAMAIWCCNRIVRVDSMIFSFYMNASMLRIERNVHYSETMNLQIR